MAEAKKESVCLQKKIELTQKRLDGLVSKARVNIGGSDRITVIAQELKRLRAQQKIGSQNGWNTGPRAKEGNYRESGLPPDILQLREDEGFSDGGIGSSNEGGVRAKAVMLREKENIHNGAAFAENSNSKGVFDVTYQHQKLDQFLANTSTPIIEGEFNQKWHELYVDQISQVNSIRKALEKKEVFCRVDFLGSALRKLSSEEAKASDLDVNLFILSTKSMSIEYKESRMMKIKETIKTMLNLEGKLKMQGTEQCKNFQLATNYQKIKINEIKVDITIIDVVERDRYDFSISSGLSDLSHFQKDGDPLVRARLIDGPNGELSFNYIRNRNKVLEESGQLSNSEFAIPPLRKQLLGNQSEMPQDNMAVQLVPAGSNSSSKALLEKPSPESCERR